MSLHWRKHVDLDASPGCSSSSARFARGNFCRGRRSPAARNRMLLALCSRRRHHRLWDRAAAIDRHCCAGFQRLLKRAGVRSWQSGMVPPIAAAGAQIRPVSLSDHHARSARPCGCCGHGGPGEPVLLAAFAQPGTLQPAAGYGRGDRTGLPMTHAIPVPDHPPKARGRCACARAAGRHPFPL
jgi:hypothetical protein